MMVSVWAPGAKAVELVLAGRRAAMEAAEGGHWTLDAERAELEAGYRFSLDGGEPVPDPRTRWQPEGVHGPSHPVDSALLREIAGTGFRQKPLRDAVIYEMHVGTFTPQGTYVAAQEKLDHLTALGVTHLELLPLATFPGAHGWGYDGVNLYAPLPAYGSPVELAQFIHACHDHGLAVLLDVVYNHVGPDGNYLGSFGPYFTDRVKTPWGEAVNYDGPHSDEVRRFVVDNALMWLEDYGFDGLRLDAVHAIFSFEAVHVLEDVATAVGGLAKTSGRPLVLIAESDLNDPRLVHPPTQGGYGLDAHWEDDFHHAVHRFFTGEADGYYEDFNGLEDLATALRDGYVYQGQYSVHRRRRHGRSPRAVAADQIVVCSQNHDQIGNRAQGERLSMLLGPDQLKAIAALTLLSPFVPMLFQGEEWGASTPFLYFTDHQDLELGRLVAEGRTKEFGAFRWQGAVPNPQAPETFARSKLNWSEAMSPAHAELLDWYRRLIALRFDVSDRFAAGRARIKFDADANWLRFEHGGLVMLFNFAATAQLVAAPAGEWDVALSSTGRDLEARSDLLPNETRVLRKQA